MEFEKYNFGNHSCVYQEINIPIGLRFCPSYRIYPRSSSNLDKNVNNFGMLSIFWNAKRWLTKFWLLLFAKSASNVLFQVEKLYRWKIAWKIRVLCVTDGHLIPATKNNFCTSLYSNLCVVKKHQEPIRSMSPHSGSANFPIVDI